jgi:hypothetical protein
MRKTLIIILLIVTTSTFFGCNSPFANTQATPSPTQFLIMPVQFHGTLSSNTTLYSGPGASFAKISELTKGTEVDVQGISPDVKWYLVTYKDSQNRQGSGWTSADFVMLDTPIATQNENSQGITTSSLSNLTLTKISAPTANLTLSPAATRTLLGINTPSFTPTLLMIPSPTLTPTSTPPLAATLLEITPPSNTPTPGAITAGPPPNPMPTRPPIILPHPTLPPIILPLPTQPPIILPPPPIILPPPPIILPPP